MKKESSTPWVNIFISPYPLGLIERFELTTKNGLEALLQRSRVTIPLIGVEQHTEVNVPFQQGRAGVNSVYLKQINTGQIMQNSLAMELFDDGRVRFFIPLQVTNVFERGAISSEVRSKQVKDVLNEYLQLDEDVHIAKFFNMQTLWNSIVVLANFYLDWLQDDISLIRDVRVQVNGRDIWRTIPFVDHDIWAEHVKQFHLPIMPYDEATIPEERKGGFILDIKRPTELWSSLLQLVGMMFGLPTETLMSLIEVSGY